MASERISVVEARDKQGPAKTQGWICPQKRQNRPKPNVDREDGPLSNPTERGTKRAVEARWRTVPQVGAVEHVTVSKPRLATLQGSIVPNTSQHMLTEHSRGCRCNGKARAMRDFSIRRRNYAVGGHGSRRSLVVVVIHLQTANARQGLG